MMSVDPKIRFTAKQALQHPWIACCSADMAIPTPLSVITALHNHVIGPKFRRCCRRFVAQMLPNNVQYQACEFFRSLDIDQTGSVKLGDLLLQSMQEKDNLCENLSENQSMCGEGHSGNQSMSGCELEYSDFVAALLPVDTDVSEQLLSSMFRRFDDENYGFVAWSDLCQAVGETHEDTYTNVLMREADQILDGKISMSAFKDYVHGTPHLSLQPVRLSEDAEVQDPSTPCSPQQLLSQLPRPLGADSPTGATLRSLYGAPGSEQMNTGGALRLRMRGTDAIPRLSEIGKKAHFGPAVGGAGCEYPMLLPHISERIAPREGSPAKSTPASCSSSRSLRSRFNCTADTSPFSIDFGNGCWWRCFAGLCLPLRPLVASIARCSNCKRSGC